MTRPRTTRPGRTLPAPSPIPHGARTDNGTAGQCRTPRTVAAPCAGSWRQGCRCTGRKTDVYCLGIDPGLTGAVAILGADGWCAVHDTPTLTLTTSRGLRHEYDAPGVAA